VVHGAPAAQRHPTQIVVAAFTIAVSIGTALLMLPVSSESAPHPGFVNSLFTSASAVTVTGLATVSIGEWSPFGEVVILLLIQVGGFGIMTIGAFLAVLATRKVGLRHRLMTQAEVGSVALGDIRHLVGGIARLTIGIEVVAALLLAARLWATGKEEEPLRALYSGTFHAISAFNNAGISLYEDNLTSLGSDVVVIGVVSIAIILGGLGFPIMLELVRRQQPRRWSLHTRITLLATAVLLVVGPLAILVFEWSNPATLGEMDTGGKLLSGWFQGISPRTAGFNTVDIGAMEEPSLLLTTALMFIGAGPASTSGGIKITTFALLAWVLWSELRGNADVNVMGRRIPATAIRQAIAIVLMAIGVIVITTMGLLVVSDVTAMDALFEATSAFGTAGLSTGITADLPVLGHLMLTALMLAGRVGPVTLATALVIGERQRVFRLAEERPILG
jgi:trk system potassium uptake protein TrkH